MVSSLEWLKQAACGVIMRCLRWQGKLGATIHIHSFTSLISSNLLHRKFSNPFLLKLPKNIPLPHIEKKGLSFPSAPVINQKIPRSDINNTYYLPIILFYSQLLIYLTLIKQLKSLVVVLSHQFISLWCLGFRSCLLSMSSKLIRRIKQEGFEYFTFGLVGFYFS